MSGSYLKYTLYAGTHSVTVTLGNGHKNTVIKICQPND